MAQFPALPLWTDAYLADTGHLSDAEHGLYLRFLMLIWRSPQCRVPNDTAWLARRFQRSEQEIETTLRPIIREFCDTTGNWITQKRLRKEWEWCQTKRKKNSDAAKAKWHKDNHVSERNATNSHSGNATTQCVDQNHSVTIPHELFSETDKPLNGNDIASCARNAPITTPTPLKKDIAQKSWPEGFIEFYSAYPKKKSKKDAAKAYEAARREVPHDTIMAGLARIKPTWRDPKYIPYPASWLRDGGYDDDPNVVAFGKPASIPGIL